MARWQLLDAGVTRHEIATRLGDHRLTELHRGVYLVGPLPSDHTHSQAALLALKGDGALSHFSAAGIWQLRSYSHLATPWVTARAQRRIARPKIHVVRADLEPADLRQRHGMALTSPPRTVLDCAILIQDDYGYEALVAEARFRGIGNEGGLEDQLSRNRGKRGAARLRRILDLPGGPQHTRSGGERAFLRLLREERIDGFQANSKAFGSELDFVWPELRFAVEVDGWDGHSGRVAFEHDRLKIAELQAAGVRVMPVTGRQIRDDRAGVTRRLRAALRARP